MIQTRGVVLLHTLIMLALLAMMASGIMRWSFARHILARKNMESSISTGVVQGVYARIYACLKNTQVGINTCTPTAATTACFPNKAELSEGKCKKVTVVIEHDPNAPPPPPWKCKIQIGFDPKKPDCDNCTPSAACP